MMNAVSIDKPLIFYSGSSKDASWWGLLKNKLNRYLGQVSLWDDNRIFTGERWDEAIEKALSRAKVAVVFLSSSYVISYETRSELKKLKALEEVGQLKIFPILLEDCDWQQLDEFRKVQLWSRAIPLSGLSLEDLERELDKIAKSIVELALLNFKPSGLEPDFVYSESAKKILRQSRNLAERSGRTGITSSCILFAYTTVSTKANDTTGFVRDVLERTGKYEEAFNDFLKNANVSLLRGGIFGGKFLGQISGNVLQILRHAQLIASEVSGASKICQRHLFAALIVAPEIESSLVARGRLSALGIDLQSLRFEFRKFLANTSTEDSESGWDNILLGNERSRSSKKLDSLGTSSRDHSTPSDASSNDNEMYLSGPAGYSSEFCGVGGDRPVADYLGVEALAHRLAELIALRETRLPLAIGLFGNWGSGKSHFMNLIDRKLKSLAEKNSDKGFEGAQGTGASSEEGLWCREIVPIYFNAWHYLDTNLWASLVTGIFDGLSAHLAPKVDELELMRARLRSAGGTTALAEEEVNQAHEAVLKATLAFTNAEKNNEGAKQVAVGLMDSLTILLPQINTPENKAQIFELLGVSAEVATLSQLAEKNRELLSIPSRIHGLCRRAFAKKGLAQRVGWLVGAAIVVPGVLFLGKIIVPEVGIWMASLQPILKTIFALLIGFVSWMIPVVTQFNRNLSQIQSWQRKAEEAQSAMPKNQQVIDAKNKVVTTEAAATIAREALTRARALESDLKEAYDNLLPERRLGRFIEARARSADYREHLGLVSLARKDFQELSDIFANAEALQRKVETLEPKEADKLKKLGASIDRIVIFVDDLDRCQPEKIADVLQAVHLLLAYPLFAVVVGVDQRCLKQSIAKQFPSLVASNEMDKEGERNATPLDYLEKIFHIPFHLPAMEEKGFSALIHNLTEPITTFFPAIDESFSKLDRAGQELIKRGHSANKSDESTVLATQIETPIVPVESVDVSTTSIVGSVPLQNWERNALKEYYSLLCTPRGATRLLNTYRLVRSGIPSSEWSSFKGDGKMNGEFRVAMLLLASAAGHPALVRDWFKILRNADSGALFLSEDSDHPPSQGWMQFKKVYDATFEQTTPQPTKELFVKWLERVERFTF